MHVHLSAESFPRLKHAVVTSGTFDGVHTGHRRILNRVLEIAGREGGESVVLTYWPHPRLVLDPGKDELRLLNTFSEKVKLLEKVGIDHLLCIPFTRAFASISSETFIQSILVDAIATRRLVIGYDHRFGRNRAGSFEDLKANGPQYGFTVEEIPRYDIDQAAVSSTAIRKYLAEGQVLKANDLLGHPYSFSGRVMHGDAIGRKIGFPTANLNPALAEDDPYAGMKLIPADGIYAVTAEISGRDHRGMLYIGTRPTVGGKEQSIELHVFEFNQDVYGQTVTVHIHDRTRGDIHFAGLEELTNQLKEDQIATLTCLDRLQIPA